MTQHISRRKWLKSTTLASLSLPFATSVTTNHSKSYRVHSQEPKVIKLSSNENPYGPSAQAKAAIIASLSMGNRYPNMLKEELRKQLAKKENLSPENILLSAGSTEILHILGNWLTHKKGNYITTKTTFPILIMCTEIHGVYWKKIDLDSNFKVDLNRLENAINDQTDVVYLCNPNNPTSTVVESSDLESFCKNRKSHQVILIDEAYIEYTKGGLKNSMAKLVKNHPNVLVIRTFSKIYGLAGMRIGYALGHPDLIKELKTNYVIASAGVSSAGLAAAIASLEDTSFVKSSYQKNQQTRKYITDLFDEWNIPYADSHTNFLYYPIEQFEQKGNNFRAAMAEANILCPPFQQQKTNYSRMTIGTQDEMEKVATVLRNLRV